MLSPAIIVIDLITLLAVCVALVLLIKELVDCLEDRRYLRAHSVNGRMELVVRRDIRVERLRVSMGASYVLLCVLVLRVPTSFAVRLDFSLTLLWSIAALVTNAALDRRFRHSLSKMEGHDDHLPSARSNTSKDRVRERRNGR